MPFSCYRNFLFVQYYLSINLYYCFLILLFMYCSSLSIFFMFGGDKRKILFLSVVVSVGSFSSSFFQYQPFQVRTDYCEIFRVRHGLYSKAL